MQSNMKNAEAVYNQLCAAVTAFENNYQVTEVDWNIMNKLFNNIMNQFTYQNPKFGYDDNSDHPGDWSAAKRTEVVAQALNWKYWSGPDVINRENIIAVARSLFDECVTRAVATISTGGVTVSTNCILHTVEVSFGIWNIGEYYEKNECKPM